MTSALVVSSPYGNGSEPATGRNVYVEGNRYIARFRLTLPNPWVGAGVAFDPATYGMPTRPASMASDAHTVLAARGRYFLSYDFADKNLCIWDLLDGDTADGDDLSGYQFDVEFVSE